MSRRRALALRCRAKGHLIASVTVDPDGTLWFEVPRPTVAVPRKGGIGHDRRGDHGPTERNLTTMIAEEWNEGSTAACACGVDYFLSMPALWQRAQAEGRTSLPLDPWHWTPPRGAPSDDAGRLSD